MELEQAIRTQSPSFWINPELGGSPRRGEGETVDALDFQHARREWQEMQPLFAHIFAELPEGSRIASPLGRVGFDLVQGESGTILLKQDHRLPVAGSIKARGGFYEVVAHAAGIARASGLMSDSEPLTALARPEVRRLLSERRVLVASTGNLGLSVGLIGSALGFQVEVFASREARRWKIDHLRSLGVQVHQTEGDYLRALNAARSEHERDPQAYFVDDEHSKGLFLGYSAAAPEVASQLYSQGYRIGPEQPLFVYLPCGIGGAPGGIAFGLKQIFGSAVHCFFAEPVAYPCMMIEMSTPVGVHPSVTDFGLGNATEADGLAVGRASLLASSVMRHRLSGVYTVEESEMLGDLFNMALRGGERLEPSAAVALAGPRRLLRTSAGRNYLQEHRLLGKLDKAVHIVWATGGSLVPETDHQRWFEAGRQFAPELSDQRQYN